MLCVDFYVNPRRIRDGLMFVDSEKLSVDFQDIIRQKIFPASPVVDRVCQSNVPPPVEFVNRSTFRRLQNSKPIVFESFLRFLIIINPDDVFTWERPYIIV